MVHRMLIHHVMSFCRMLQLAIFATVLFLSRAGRIVGPQIPSCTCGTPSGRFGIDMTRAHPGIHGVQFEGS
jgi:hypothetical protein